MAMRFVRRPRSVFPELAPSYSYAWRPYESSEQSRHLSDGLIRPLDGL